MRLRRNGDSVLAAELKALGREAGTQLRAVEKRRYDAAAKFFKAAKFRHHSPSRRSGRLLLAGCASRGDDSRQSPGRTSALPVDGARQCVGRTRLQHWNC